MSAPIGPTILQQHQGSEALRVARRALDAWILRGESLLLEQSQTGMDGIRAPAFVSLYLEGQLRGCVGTLDPDLSLATALIECAVAAATRDPRFPPLTSAELPRIRLEVSVLTMPAPLERPEGIVIGRDGIVVEMDGKKGLLLPQVAWQHGWAHEEFLDQACLKAGLARSAWRTGARIWAFQAQVFAEP